MLHKNRYPVWPNGWRKKESGLGPLSGILIEEYDARYCFDPHDLTDAGNPWGLPNFLWIDDGAGYTLSSNASLDMSTVVGSLTNGYRTPYQYPDGSTDETCQQHAAASYRYDSTHPLSWSIDDDIVFVTKLRFHDNYTASTDRYDIWSNSPHGTDFFNFYLASANNLYYAVNDDSLSHAAVFTFPEEVSRRTWHFALGIIDRSAERLYGWLDGAAGSSVFDGVINNHAYTGQGFCIGARMPGGGTTYPAHQGLCVDWISIWNGTDLYEAWTASSNYLINRITFESLGLRETAASPAKVYSYSRPDGAVPGGGNGGTSYVDHNGVWWFSDMYVPTSGNPNGALITGMAYNRAVDSASVANFNPQNTTGWTATGGIFSVVSDAVALAALNMDIWGPNVYSFQNSTGSAQRVYCGSNCSASICHFHVFARYVGGANATMGWRDTSSGVYTSVGTLLDNYALTTVLNQTPGGTDWKFCIDIPDGCRILFIGQSLNNYTVANPVSINKYPFPRGVSAFYTTVGVYSVYRQSDKGMTEYTPVTTSGSILINTASAGWGGTTVGADTLFLSGNTTAGDLLHAESAAPGWATSDGTVQISTGAPVDGSYLDVWTAWQGALQYIQQGILGTPVTGAYDGDKGCTGVLKTGMTTGTLGGDYWVKTIQIRQV